jgi:RNA polymerase sigma factor (sigma-70 family)
MAAGQLNNVIRHLRYVLERNEAAGTPDVDLLKRYVSEGDEAAFEALVQRHGPLVWGVCRRVLRNPHDAEDAFQATFLVLVSKASAIRSPRALGNWLYGVAYRTAPHARHRATRRRAKEAAMPTRTETPEDAWAELLPVLDQDLERLPEKYRSVIVLCELQGKTRREAALLLGCREGTVASRLARGLALLAKRLTRHGLSITAGALAVVLSHKAAAAGVPTLMVSSTVKAASLFAAGQAAAPGAISVKVAALTEGVLKTMLLTKLKLAMVLLLVVCLIIGGSAMICQMQAAEHETGQTDTPKHPAADMVSKNASALVAGEGKGGDAVQEIGAEMLYLAMEKKVRGAKSLQVAVDSEVDSKDFKGTVKTTIYATQPNKSRLEIDFTIDGKADKLLFLTDGKARYTKQGDKGTLDPDPKKAAAEGKLVPGIVARMGVSAAMIMARSAKQGEEKEVDLDKDVPVTDFKLGAKEMVGKSMAQVVSYQLDFDGISAKMSLWIDTNTHLPLKRVVTVDEGGQMIRITETYSTFTIDAKLDPKLFELPNE